MTNPPSVPSLDVEACVNPERLRNLADRILNMADGRADRDPASLRREAEFVRALASALPGMGKDSERLDALESWTKGDQTICPPGNHGGENTHRLLARDDDAKGDRYGIWSETTEGPTLREAIDAARAAQPEETSAECDAIHAEMGARCELPLGHEGQHAALRNEYDERGSIPELRWSPFPERPE